VATAAVFLTATVYLQQVLNSAFNRHGFVFSLAGALTYRASSQYLYTAGPGTQAEYEIKRQLRRGGAADLNIYTWAPGDGLLGWATFPWDYKIGGWGSMLDGVVVRTATLPGGSAKDYNLGNTVVHEVGHWLGEYSSCSVLISCKQPFCITDDLLACHTAQQLLTHIIIVMFI
jgi:hypothetical protein